MNIENRLSKLESKTASDDDFKVFRVIGDSDEECQAAIDRLIASGEARPTDHFVSRITRPGVEREDAQGIAQTTQRRNLQDLPPKYCVQINFLMRDSFSMRKLLTFLIVAIFDLIEEPLIPRHFGGTIRSHLPV